MKKILRYCLHLFALTVVLCLMVFPARGAGRSRYVDARWNGRAAQTEVSPGRLIGVNAFASLQAAAHAADAGDVIHLSPGLYRGFIVSKDLTITASEAGAIIMGASPALTITAGSVSVNGATFATATADPTILVTGGSLTMRNCAIDESSGFDQTAISVTGSGTVDLGTVGDPGGNTIKIVTAGSLISNATASPISALGNTWKQDGSVLASNFTIEDEIFHALDDATKGLVTWVANNVYVTTSTLGIQRGIDAATAGDTVNVGPGTYDELVSINKNLSLLSGSGRAATTIQNTAGTGLGAVVVTGPTTGVQIGDVGQGFTIIGTDGTPGLEEAAIYFQFNHSNAKVIGNNVVAAGDAGLQTEFGATISNMTVTDNEFSGQTFIGPNPADFGFANQFTTPNVPRQLVAISGGSGGGSHSGITFSCNVISGTAGGTNIALQPQGNTLVTIDATGSTIQYNTFSGISTRFADGLRARGTNATITGNLFTGGTPVGLEIGSLAGVSSTAHVVNNSFAATYPAALGNGGAAQLDAQSNWWGSATGPTIASNPGGTGGIVAGNVDFSPWVGEATDTSGACGFQPNNTNIVYAPLTLTFSTQPGGSNVCSVLSTQPVVQVLDENSNVATQFQGAVTIAIGSNPGGGMLGGTLSVNAVNGVATFAGLSINQPGVGYTLVASVTGLSNTTSLAFDILNAAPVITVLGANPLTNECHVAFVDPGFTALDDCTAMPTLTTNNLVNTNVPGSYTVTYVATDANGKSATNTRVVVMVDTTAPVITVLGANPLTNECSVTFVDPGFTALDSCATPSVSAPTTFDTFTTGVSVNYQGTGGTRTYASVPPGAGIYTVPDPYGSLWTVADEWGFGKFNINANPLDDLDERVVDDGTGNKVWRLSNARTSSFSDQPNSPSSPAAAGETTAFLWNDRGSNHTTPVISARAGATSRYFHGGFRFKSATGAAQAGLQLNVSPTARQSDRRNSFLRLVDSGAGFNLQFIDTGIGGSFPVVEPIIATGLSYTAWHRIDIFIQFVDGLNGDASGNDIVTVKVNDVTVHVGTTWETFYRSPGGTPTRPVGAVDALMFRSSTAAPATLGNGFFFDDVVVDNNQALNLMTTGTVNSGTPGTYTITYAATDPSGNSATNTRTVVVVDTTPPVVACTNVTVSLTGLSVSITPAQVYASGSDACGTPILVAVTPDTFSCPGVYTATLYVSDGNGNTNTCNSTVTVLDGRPTPTVVYVDDGYVGLTNCASVDFPYTGAGSHIIGYDAFATVQGGITGVASGGTVNVAAGSYSEAVNANKAVTLLGADAANVCGGSQSVINAGAGIAITISASGVTVKGFELQGATGVRAVGQTGFVVQNNKITAAALGMDLESISTAVSAFTVQDNCVTLTTQLPAPTTPSVGILLAGVVGPNAPTIQDNNVAGAYYGYLLYAVNAAAPTVVTGGTITGVMQGVAVINVDPVTFTVYAPSSFGVNGVSMSGFAGNHPALPAANFHAGVYVFTGGAVPAATLTGNLQGLSISGTGKPAQDSAGLAFADFSTGIGNRQNITVQECIIQNNLNRGISVRGSNALVSVTRSTLTDNGGDPFGAGGNDGFGIIARNNSTVSVTECFITNPAAQVGFTVRAIAADASTGPEGPTLTVFNCSIDNNGNPSGKLAQQSAGTLNASGNWWGGNAEAAIAAGIIGTVDFTPFLNVGTDTAGTAGFQGSFSALHVTILGAQTGPASRVQEGIDLVTASTVYVHAGTYPGNIIINIDNLNLIGDGIGLTIIDRTTGTCPGTVGISITGSRTGVTITGLTVQHFEDGIQMFTGPATNILLEDVQLIDNCRHGFWSQAFGINGLTFRRVDASRNNFGGGNSGRGLWVINGVKQNIVVEDGTYMDNGLVGIDISDGNVTDSRISGNVVSGNGDSGIGVLGPQGPGATLVAFNSVTNNGRFGIEIKNPTGTGASSGAGSVVVVSNTVVRNLAATDVRDYAGILVMRRAPVPADNADQPTGVYIERNNVSGFHRKPAGSTGDGFGVVVAGENHRVLNNTATDCDIAYQVQGGNTANVQSTPYFDRDNASSGGALLAGNVNAGNQVGFRAVGATAKAILEGNTLTGDTQAGVQVTLGAIVDAGDCTGANVTGLGLGSGLNGSSAGGNDLSGYVFDNLAPWAVEDLNSSAQSNVLAQNNNFGPAANVEDAVFDDSDTVGTNSQALFAQTGSLTITCPLPVSVQCVTNVPAGATNLAQFLAQGGVASASPATVAFSDGPLTPGPDEGTITRTYTVSNACGSTAICMQTITVDDTTPPLLVCKPFAANLTGATVSITPADVFDSGSDNCGSVQLVSVVPDTFTCQNIGANTVTLTAHDGHGNTNTCSATVTVVDLRPPLTVVYVDDGYVGLTNGAIVKFPYLGIGADHVIGCDAFTNIQGGIAAVNVGGTVNVAAGNYAENVTLTKRVNLLGARNGVDARGRVVGAPSPAVESILAGAVFGTPTIELSVGAQSIIDGFVLSGGGGGTIGVIRSSTSQIDEVQILNNHIAPFSDAAIWFNRGGTNITVGRNVMDGSAMTAGSQIVFLNGPQNFAGLQVLCNWIQNGGTRAGFFVDGTFRNVGPTANRQPQFLQNLFANNNVGINMGSRSFLGGLISMNVFTNSAFDGLQGGPQDSLISSNLFVNNGRWGLALTSFSSAVAGRGASNDVITCNTFTGNGFVNSGGGVLFSAVQPAGNNGSHHLNFNNISGNSTGLVYTASEIVDAKSNWWGAASGPTHASNPGGAGDIINGGINVLFVPFLTADTSFPSIICPANIIAVNDPGQCSAVVNFAPPTVVSPPCCPGSITVGCNPASGSAFPVGTNVVTCSATNACGNVSTCTFTVTVLDTEDPLITCSTNRIVECTSPLGTPVFFTIAATDNCGPTTIFCSMDSGDLFPEGTTTVSCAAYDAISNSSVCSFTVTVVDTTAPVISCPANMVVGCNRTNGAVVFFTVGVTDNCDTNVTLTCTPTNGSLFLLGTTNTVTCTAVDHSGNTNGCSFTIAVVEMPPVLSIEYTYVGTNLDDGVIVSWPVSCNTYVLEETTSLNPVIVWTPTPEPVVVLGYQNTVTAIAGSNRKFFRLRYP